MDTRKKTRSASQKPRDRSENRDRSAASRQQNTARKQRPENQARRPEQKGAQTARRSREHERNTEQAARRQQEETRRQLTAPSSDAPEMVFRMDGTEERKKRAAQDPAAAKRADMRQRSARRTEERRQQARRRSKAPKVTYTDPRPIQVSHLLMRLIIVLAVVVAITLGLSVFFKVEKVMVYGNNAYSAWTVQEASGIEGGEKLLTFGNIRACGKIKAALPYVDTVRIGINLPDTVNIYITEFDVVYAIRSQNGTWWLMTSGGRIVEQTDAGTAGGYTQVLGVELDNPVAGEQAKAYEPAVQTTDSTGAADATEDPLATVPVTVTANDRLNAALTILESLELNDLVGEAASVDVTSLTNIELWYGNQYQVRIGQINDSVYSLDYKIAAMKAAVAQLSDYQTGILDVSFTTWEDQPGYTPFE